MSEAVVNEIGGMIAVDRFDPVAKTGVISLSQECGDIMQSCSLLRSQDVLRGHRKMGEFHHVARIPLAVVETLKAHGMDIMQDDAALKRFLNDPVWQAFRTSNGTV